MLQTVWSQNGGENSMLPVLSSGQRAVTGCGVTATAQLMNYWKYPAQGLGDNYYLWSLATGEQQVLDADFKSTSYDWDNMLPLYKGNSSATQQQIDAVSTLMLHIGIALEMKFNTSSATQIEYIHTVLKKYFGYNKNSQLVRFINGAYSQEEWLTMIYKELSEGRPILMGGRYEGEEGSADHIFVADGYDEEGRVHLNLGKADIGFNKNTYYDLTRTDQTYTRNLRMIIGVCPETLEVETTEVNVQTAGTLLDKLGGEKSSMRICRLKVTGSLNEADMQILAKLTRTTTGQLSYLDLSECTIEGNELPALCFCDNEDNNYTLQEIILPEGLETIGVNAFKNCCGLYSVTFPGHLQHIGHYAFSNCRYLSDVRLPQSLKSIGENPFRYDKLESLEMSADNPYFQVKNYALLSKNGNNLYLMQQKCVKDYIIPSGVERIERRAFVKDCRMASVVLPASVKYVSNDAFIECHGLQNVFCRASIAPAFSGSPFDASSSGATLHVPVGCINEYQQKGWTMFANIVDDIQRTYSDVIAEKGYDIAVEPMIRTTWTKNNAYQHDGSLFNPSSAALVMAQVMNYWKSPIKGNGKLFFTHDSSQGENVIFSADFSENSYHWGEMDGDLGELSNQGKNAVAQLLYYCTVATFNQQNTETKRGSTLLGFCSAAMKKYFGYNRNMHLLGARFYEKSDWVNAIYQELSEGRPIMVENLLGGNDEVYLIDGYNEDGLLHVKKDEAEIFIQPDDERIYSSDVYILVGITPFEQEDETVTVNLTEEGTLAETLGDNRTHIAQLKLKGVLNYDDIGTLKEMAKHEKGQLFDLDLSDVEIVENELAVYAFQYCDLLQYVKLPFGLESIGRHGFSYCHNLLHVDMPGLKSIGNYAFFSCKYLDELTLPASVTTLGDNPFAGNKMSQLQVEGNNAFIIEDKTLLSNDGTMIYSCMGSYEGDYSIPRGVSQVRNMAFRGCDGLNSVHIPSDVRSIGSYSFYECYQMKDVYCYSTIAPSLSSSEEGYAFYPECSEATLHVPEGCIDEYKSKHWDKFAFIIDDLPNIATQIDFVDSHVDNASSLYSIDGKRAVLPQSSHIYIIRDEKGKVWKEYVR